MASIHEAVMTVTDTVAVADAVVEAMSTDETANGVTSARGARFADLVSTALGIPADDPGITEDLYRRALLRAVAYVRSELRPGPDGVESAVEGVVDAACRLIVPPEGDLIARSVVLEDGSSYTAVSYTWSD